MLDESIIKTAGEPAGKNLIRKVFPVLSFSTFCAMLGVGIVAPLLPAYARDLGASGLWIGVIFAGFSASRAVFAPVAGYLSDRYGRRLFVVVGLLLSALISFAYIWGDSVPKLVIIRLLHGAAGGIVFPVAQAYIGDLAPRGREGTWMGYYTSSFFTAFAVGPMLGGLLTDQFGMIFAFLSMGGLSLLSFLAAVIMLPEIRNRQTVAGAKPSFASMGRSGVIQGLFIYRLTSEVGWGISFTFLPIVASVSLGLSSTLTGILLSANMLLTSVLMPILGRVADRLNRKMLILIGGLMAALQLGLTSLVTEFWQLLALCIIGGVGGAITAPAVAALSVEEGRKYGMATTITMMTIAISIGVAVGPIIAGALVDASGLPAAFFLATATGVLGIMAFLIISRKP